MITHTTAFVEQYDGQHILLRIVHEENQPFFHHGDDQALLPLECQRKHLLGNAELVTHLFNKAV